MIKKKNKKEEELLQLEFCDWVKNRWPDLMINVDLSGIKLTQHQAQISSQMRSNNEAYPDFTLYKLNNQYCGLMLELKKAGTVVFKRDGYIRKNEHLEKQYRTILKLRKEGWCADFAIGLDECKEKFKKYMNIK